MLRIFKKIKIGDVLEVFRTYNEKGKHEMRKGELCAVEMFSTSNKYDMIVIDDMGLQWSINKGDIRYTKKSEAYQKIRDEAEGKFGIHQTVEIVKQNKCSGSHGLKIGTLVRVVFIDANSKRFPYTVIDATGCTFFVSSNEISITKKSERYGK